MNNTICTFNEENEVIDITKEDLMKRECELLTNASFRTQKQKIRLSQLKLYFDKIDN